MKTGCQKYRRIAERKTRYKKSLTSFSLYSGNIIEKQLFRFMFHIRMISFEVYVSFETTLCYVYVVLTGDSYRISVSPKRFSTLFQPQLGASHCCQLLAEMIVNVAQRVNCSLRATFIFLCNAYCDWLRLCPVGFIGRISRDAKGRAWARLDECLCSQQWRWHRGTPMAPAALSLPVKLAQSGTLCAPHAAEWRQPGRRAEDAA